MEYISQFPTHHHQLRVITQLYTVLPTRLARAPVHKLAQRERDVQERTSHLGPIAGATLPLSSPYSLWSFLCAVLPRILGTVKGTFHTWAGHGTPTFRWPGSPFKKQSVAGCHYAVKDLKKWTLLNFEDCIRTTSPTVCRIRSVLGPCQ